MSNYLMDAIEENIQTSQSVPIQGREAEMKQNSALGFTFQIDEFSQLERFLILGTENGTYYAKEHNLTKENLHNVEKAIINDGIRVVDIVVDISDKGRAPKNDPALLVLAMCASSKDYAVRRAALYALPKVARTGTHLFHFVNFVRLYRGWGSGLRKAINKWYIDRPIDSLINQVTKYRHRDGWTHRDILRLSHPKTTDEIRNSIFNWITHNEHVPEVLGPSVALMKATTAAEAVSLIREYNLPRELVPTSLLNESSVWEALLEDMPMTAMIRNLGKMTNIGLLNPLSDNARYIADRLDNMELLNKARIHPITILMAMRTYEKGHGEKGHLVWKPNRTIVNALNSAFYKAFKIVKPSGKKQLIALDVSDSMRSPILGTSLTCREASAAMALITMNVEPEYHVVGFTCRHEYMNSDLTVLDISPQDSLDTVLRKISNLPFGGTDCSLPFLYALKNNLDVDAFSVYTDNETWAGAIHPAEAFVKYRTERCKNSKSVVVGMTATSFSIADPMDLNMMDVCGFDTAVPSLISDFFSK